MTKKVALIPVALIPFAIACPRIAITHSTKSPFPSPFSYRPHTSRMLRTRGWTLVRATTAATTAARGLLLPGCVNFESSSSTCSNRLLLVCPKLNVTFSDKKVVNLTDAKKLERMVNQNTYDDVLMDLFYWEDPSDEFKVCTSLLSLLPSPFLFSSHPPAGHGIAPSVVAHGV